MPVAHNQTISVSDKARDCLPPLLNMSLFEQTTEYIDKAKMWHKGEVQDIHKAEALRKGIEAAQQTIAKAEEKREALLKKRALLKTSLEHMKSRQIQALEYWQDYGLDIKQITTEQEDCERYEFIYSKLPDKSQDQASSQGSACTVCIEHRANNLHVVSLDPILIDDEQLSMLNSKLTHQCVELSGKVNYKSAMILIKKTLIENMSRQNLTLPKSTTDSESVSS